MGVRDWNWVYERGNVLKIWGDCVYERWKCLLCVKNMEWLCVWKMKVAIVLKIWSDCVMIMYLFSLCMTNVSCETIWYDVVWLINGSYLIMWCGVVSCHVMSCCLYDGDLVSIKRWTFKSHIALCLFTYFATTVQPLRSKFEENSLPSTFCSERRKDCTHEFKIISQPQPYLSVVSRKNEMQQ